MERKSSNMTDFYKSGDDYFERNNLGGQKGSQARPSVPNNPAKVLDKFHPAYAAALKETTEALNKLWHKYGIIVLRESFYKIEDRSRRG